MAFWMIAASDIIDLVWTENKFGLEKSPFNPLRGKQIDHPYMYF